MTSPITPKDFNLPLEYIGREIIEIYYTSEEKPFEYFKPAPYLIEIISLYRFEIAIPIDSLLEKRRNRLIQCANGWVFYHTDYKNFRHYWLYTQNSEDIQNWIEIINNVKEID